MRWLRGFVAATDWLSRTTGWAMAVLMPAMAAVLFVEVFSRYGLRSPTSWAQESAIFMFAAVGLIAGADAMRRKSHISVDLFYAGLSPRGKALLDVLVGPVVFFFLGLVIVYGAMAAIDAFAFGLRRPNEPNFPLGPLLALIPLGAFLVLLQALSNWLQQLVFLRTGKELER